MAVTTTMKETQLPLPATEADIEALIALRSDQTVWGLDDIQAALGLGSRSQVLRLYRATQNYLSGALARWPPPREAQRAVLPVPPGARPVGWWPPDAGVLPPPDYGDTVPRWTAGTIREWAQQVGRMEPDGTPITALPQGRAPAVPEKPDASLVDVARLEAMVADETLWTARDIAQYFEVSETLVTHWYRATYNRVEGGIRTWPPTRADRTASEREDESRPVDWWPPHPAILPPPAQIRRDVAVAPPGNLHRYLWRAGAIRLWGLNVGRLLPDGTLAQGGQ